MGTTLPFYCVTCHNRIWTLTPKVDLSWLLSVAQGTPFLIDALCFKLSVWHYFVFNKPFPGNTRTVCPMLTTAVPFAHHYFYGKINYLYLIGTVVQNFERTRELCFFFISAIIFLWSNWKHPIYLQSLEICLKAILLHFEVSCLVTCRVSLPLQRALSVSG